MRASRKTASGAADALPETVDDSRLRALAGYQLRRADLALQQSFVREIGTPFGLRQVDFSVLVLLASQPVLAHKQISRALGVAPSNLVGVMNALAERELVTRQADHRDGRRVLWTLTEAGRALEAQAAAGVAAMERRLFGDTDRIARLNAVLDGLWPGRAERD